jgi:amidase
LDAFTQVGPLARYVEDLALVLPLIGGPDGQDPSIAPVPLGDPATVDLPRLRGAYYTDNGIQTPTPEVIRATRAAVEALMDAGIRCDEVRPPGTEESLELYATLLRGWDGGARVRLLLERVGTALDATSLDRFLAAPSLPADELVRLIDRWDRFRTGMLRFLERHDIIIAPVNAYPALPHGQLGTMYPGFSYTMAYNLTGWPAAVVRAGTSPGGLPIGVQVVAHPWREDVALAVAAALERALGGWQPPPRFEKAPAL